MLSPIGARRHSGDGKTAIYYWRISATAVIGFFALLSLAAPSSGSGEKPKSGVASHILSVSKNSLHIGGWAVGAYPEIADMAIHFDGSHECERKVVTWRRHSVRAWVYTPVDGAACSAGEVSVVFLGGDWRTARGLSVGATAARTHTIYPRAARQHGAWLNLGVPNVKLPSGQEFGCGYVASLPCGQVLAHIVRGRVTEFAVRVGVHIGE